MNIYKITNPYENTCFFVIAKTRGRAKALATYDLDIGFLEAESNTLQGSNEQGMGRTKLMDKTTDLSTTEALFNDLLNRTGSIVPTTPQRMARVSREKTAQAEIEPVLSIVEAAKACGISRHQIDNAINGGELAFYSFGDRRKVKLSDLKRWLESKRTKIGIYN